jgi:hypothetical protein
MARLEYIEHRLCNWARWKLGRSISYASVNLEDADMPRTPFADKPIPVTDCEASDTDDAVELLPRDLKDTVHEVYLGKGSDADRLRRLGVAKSTMHERVGLAHRMLASHFTNAGERARTERERVESLRATARP